MKKFFLVLFTGLLLSVELPAQGFLNSLNKALNGLTQDSQQRNSYNKSLRSSYERWQKKENDKKKNKDKENVIDNENRTTRANKQEPGTTMLKEEGTPVLKQEQTTAPQSNEKVITLVVNGTGETKEDATKNALRSAIEQAFGTFVSANTEVLNDELIKDEITTVSTGNIKSYKELSISQTSNGLYDASVQATVSIDQLTKFAQSKGMQAELAGASFVMNMKMRELNKKNEILAISHMLEKAKAIADNGLFDYKLEIGEPKLEKDSKYSIKLKVLFCESANTIAFYETIYKTLQALSLTEQEQQEYRNSGVGYFWYDAYLNNSRFGGKAEIYALRNSYPVLLEYGNYSQPIIWFMPMIIEAALSYVIKDNIGNSFYCSKKSIKTNNKMYVYKDYISYNNFNCIWDFYDEKSQTAYLYELCPKDRLSFINRGLGNDDWRLPLHFTGDCIFNPSVTSKGKRRSFIDNPDKAYYYQQFLVIYPQEELSKLNSIVINHY